MSKKVIIPTGVIIFILAFFLLVEFASNKKVVYDSTDELALSNNSLINRFNHVQEKYQPSTGPVKFSNDNGYFLKLSADGKEVYYYLPSNGQIKAAAISNLTSHDSPVSSIIGEIKPGFKKIDWAKNGRKLIASSDKEIVYYNLDSGFSKKLDPKIINPTFSSDNKVAYLYFDLDTGDGEIKVANSDFENSKDLLKTRSETWQLTWLNSKTLGLITNNSFFTLNIDSGDLDKILEGKKDLVVNPSPNGDSFIYSYLDDSGEIRLYHYIISNQEGAPVNATSLASACIWNYDSFTIYCAVGGELKAIGTGNGLVKNLVKDNILANAQNLILSSAEDYLIFKNSQDQKLYALHLNQ